MARQKLRRGIVLFSFFLFPAIFYYLSPVVIIQSTMGGVINSSFIIFLLMFISALFLAEHIVGGFALVPDVKRPSFPQEIKKYQRAIMLNGSFDFRGSVLLAFSQLGVVVMRK